MSEEKKIHRSHRLCPCNPMDIEGIQTWLEDMAQDGLILEKESVFFGFWSFEKSTPQKVLYRLEVVQGKFLEDTDTPQLDMLETAEAMGWEYVTKYAEFNRFYKNYTLEKLPVWLLNSCCDDLNNLTGKVLFISREITKKTGGSK